MLILDWTGLNWNFVGEQLGEVNKFSYLGGCISLSGRISDEASSRIQKIRLEFTDLRHLWHRQDIRLTIVGSGISNSNEVGAACYRAPLRAEDMRRHSLFEIFPFLHSSSTCCFAADFQLFLVLLSSFE